MVYKITNDKYVVALSTTQGTPITESEYINILQAIKSAPHKDGYGYRLREDLTWESYELPPEPPVEDEVTAEQILADLEAIL